MSTDSSSAATAVAWSARSPASSADCMSEIAIPHASPSARNCARAVRQSASVSARRPNDRQNVER